MDIFTFIQNHKILEFVPELIIWLMAIYFVVKILDFVSGLTRTWVKREKFKSAVMREGIGRWIGEVVGLALLIIIDLLFGLKFYLTGVALALFIYKEAGSIKENIEKLGVVLPSVADNFLDKLGKGDFKK